MLPPKISFAISKEVSAVFSSILMRAHVEQFIDNEIERVRSRSGNEIADEISRSLHRVTNALLHTPSVRAH